MTSSSSPVPDKQGSIDTDRIRERNMEITGKPPRIEPCRTEEVLAPARQLMAKISGAASGKATSVPDEHIPEMLLTAMCNRELFELLVNVSVQLLKNSSFEVRDRQLIILRVGWLQQIPYIWGEHVAVSKRVGLSSTDIEHVTVGSSSSHWTDHERAVMQAVEELIETAMISDNTWDVLARDFDEKQLFELPVVVGQFSTVGYFQNALRIRLSAGNEGLLSR